METPAFFTAVFLWCLLISVTGYSIYMGFGPPSKELLDPFEKMVLNTKLNNPYQYSVAVGCALRGLNK